MNIEHLPAYPQRDRSLSPSAYLAIGRSLVFNIYSVSLVYSIPTVLARRRRRLCLSLVLQIQ